MRRRSRRPALGLLGALLAVSLGSADLEAQEAARKPAVAAAPATGSLWQRGSKRSLTVRPGITRPPIAKQDILMVIVLETATASNNARLDTQRKTETDLLLDQFVRFSGHKLKPDFSPQPNIELEAQRKLRANGKTDRNELMRMRVAVKVVDVRPNGNLIIEARKERRINDEKTLVTLAGEIRAADVDDDYNITSDRVAELKLAYHGTGPISRNAGESWFTWIVDHIWPF